MSPPVSLPVVPVGEVRALSDRFRCVPYSCTMGASSCIAQQRLANGSRKNGTFAPDHVRLCIGCKDGEAVAKQLAVDTSKPPPRPDLPPKQRYIGGRTLARRRCTSCQEVGHDRRSCSKGGAS